LLTKPQKPSEYAKKKKSKVLIILCNSFMYRSQHISIISLSILSHTNTYTHAHKQHNIPLLFSFYVIIWRPSSFSKQAKKLKLYHSQCMSIIYVSLCLISSPTNRRNFFFFKFYFLPNLNI
jgi:hypothetical protein